MVHSTDGAAHWMNSIRDQQSYIIQLSTNVDLETAARRYFDSGDSY